MMKFLIQCIILSMQEKQWETCQQLSGFLYTNENFDTYNSLTPNWYYKVLR